MQQPQELTIIIPAKNEEQYIGLLLKSLLLQTYPFIHSTPIIIADANSHDATRKIALSFADRLNIQIIDGGLPAYGRNIGAHNATTPYLLFLDADITLPHARVISHAIRVMKRKEKQCLTTFIICQNGTLSDHIMYTGHNFFQLLSWLRTPFATGMFMLIKREVFTDLGGFNEQVRYAEDFYLTRNIKPSAFSVIPDYIIATNRRFQKMGRSRVIKLFLQAVWRHKHDDFFFQDRKYWD